MRKPTSKGIQLVLISSLLASCNQQPAETSNAEPKQRVFMRADSTAQYTDVTKENWGNNNQTHNSGFGASPLLWYMAFRHLGGGMGYSSPGIHRSSVVGTNTGKANHMTQRGGFGKSSRDNSFSAGS